MKTIKAELITIGNELLAGYTVNTNATFISQELLSVGITVIRVTTIRDTEDDIIAALTNAGKRADVVLVSGGLGPTPDDITKKCILDFFKTKMVFSQQVLDDVRSILQKRSLNSLQSNQNQAMVPESALILRNPVGTAPGLVLTKNNVPYIFMPGVPQEMKRIMHDHVLEYLSSTLSISPLHTHLLRTTGITEAGLYEKVKDIVDSENSFQLSFLPKGIGVDLRIMAAIQTDEDFQSVQKYISSLRSRIKKFIFTEDDITLAEVLGNILRDRSLTIAIAESFTGGLITDWITDIPGSSDYFLGSAVTYSNQSKIDFLGVSEKTLQKYGAVSKQTVIEMVKGIQGKFNSHCAIASTGVAGPGGGTKKKPVGLCYLAAINGEKIKTVRFMFGNNRLRTKRRGAITGLELLRRLILEIS